MKFVQSQKSVCTKLRDNPPMALLELWFRNWPANFKTKVYVL